MREKNGQITKEAAGAYLKRAAEVVTSTRLRRAVLPIVGAVVALAVSGVETVFGVCPFGVAMLCSAHGFLMSSAVLIGAVLGAVEGGGLPLIGVLCGVYVIRFAMSYFTTKKFTVEKSLNEPFGLRLASATAASAAMSMIAAVGAENMLRSIAAAVFSLCVFPAFTASFLFLQDENASRKLRLAGLMGTMLCVGSVLSGLELPFDMTAVFAFAAAIVLSYKNGAAIGAAAGVSAAIAGEPVFAPMYALAALTAGLLFDFSAVSAVAVAALVSIGWSLYCGGLSGISEILPEIVFASAAVAPLISCKFIRKNELFCVKSEQKSVANMLPSKVERISESFEAISKLLCTLADRMECPTRENAERMCSGARGKFCSGCTVPCAGSEADAFFERAALSLVRSGRVSAKLVPEELARRCHNIDGILDNINTAAKISARLSGSVKQTKLFAGDYKAIAELLRSVTDPENQLYEKDTEGEKRLSAELNSLGVHFGGVSVYGKREKRVYIRSLAMPSEAGESDIREICERVLDCRLSSPEFGVDGGIISLSMHTEKRISFEMGKFSSPFEGESASGDTIVSFENDEGYLYSLVSDGMGSGREAALASGISGAYLEKLLSAGCPMKSALELLNTFICGGENECFATIDLMEADLFSGRASFIKSGAAPSFVLRDGKVFRLHSKTVPIGIIRALDAEVIRLDLQAGDMVIMVSDGVTGSYEDCPWLYELLQDGDIGGCSPSIAARLIGERAHKMSGGKDDISVLAMRVKEI